MPTFRLISHVAYVIHDPTIRTAQSVETRTVIGLHLNRWLTVLYKPMVNERCYKLPYWPNLIHSRVWLVWENC